VLEFVLVICKIVFLGNQQVRGSGNRPGCERNFQKHHTLTDDEFKDIKTEITDGNQVIISLAIFGNNELQWS